MTPPPVVLRAQLREEQRDELTRMFTAFRSWEALSTAIWSGYVPTIRARAGRAGRSALLRALRLEVAVVHGPDRVFPELSPEERIRVMRRREVAA